MDILSDTVVVTITRHTYSAVAVAVAVLNIFHTLRI